jgi:hypothetical protein
MNAYVKVYQLESNRGKSFLNPTDEDGYIGVWGSSYEKPTILAIDGINFNLISFDNEEYYNEWFEKNKKNFDYFYVVTKSGVEMYYAKQ